MHKEKRVVHKVNAS